MTYNRLRIWKFKTIPYKLNHPFPVRNILKQLAVVVCQGGSDVTKPAPKQILGNAALAKMCHSKSPESMESQLCLSATAGFFGRCTFNGMSVNRVWRIS
jgi:hypothetical protein